MTFDEALKEVDELGSSWLGGRFDHWTPDEVHNLVVKLKETYAPTIEMTQRAYKFLKEEHDKFIKTGNDHFLSNNGLGNWRFNDEHKIDIESGEAYIDEFTAAHNHFKGMTRTDVIRAWLHPETIKIVDE